MGTEATTLGLGAALLLGLGFGAGPCNIACLPFLGPVLLATGEGARRGWRILLPFSLGRLCGYGTIGLAAGMGGQLAADALGGSPAHWLLGGATLIAAVGLWVRLRRRTVACAVTRPETAYVSGPESAHGSRSLLPGGLFLMGAAMALNPCAPLGAVALAAAAGGSAAGGLSLGLSFGIGAAAVPALILGLGVAHLGGEIKAQLMRWRGAVEGISVAMLILVGVTTALGWMTP